MMLIKRTQLSTMHSIRKQIVGIIVSRIIVILRFYDTNERELHLKVRNKPGN